MENRNTYLSSLEGGHLKSDFNRIKRIIDDQINSINEILTDFPAFDPHDAVLSETELKKTHAEQLQIRRNHYINQLASWLKNVESAITQRYSDSLSRPLTQPTIKQRLQQQLLATVNIIKKGIDALKEARDIERYQKAQEIRFTEQGQVILEELKLDLESGDFKRVNEDQKSLITPRLKGVQGRKHKDPAEWVVAVNQREYLALQKLGGTFNYRVQGHLIDKCLIAQTTNIFGTFRRQQLYTLVRFRKRTITFFAKETVCQHAFKRLDALRKVASALGGSISELSQRLEEYKNVIQTLKATLNADKKKEEQNPGYDGVQKQWFENIYDEYDRGLQADLDEIKTFQKKIQSVIDKHPDIERKAELYAKDPFDTSLTLFELGHWLKGRVLDIIATARSASNVLDTAELGTLSTGQFIQVLAKADIHNSTYRFDYTGRMDPLYQGDFDPHNQGKLRYLSSSDLAHDPRDVRDALFGTSCVVTGLTEPDQIRALVREINPDLTTSRGWLRLPRLCNPRSKQHAEIMEEIENAEILTQNQQIFQLYELLRANVQAAADESYTHAFYQFGEDVCYAAAATVIETGYAVKEFRSKFAKKWRDDFTYTVTAVNTKVKIDDEIESSIVFSSASAHEEKHDEPDLEQGIADYKLVKWQPYDPHTLPSMLGDVVSAICDDFYSKELLSRSYFYVVTGAFGVLGSIAAYHPETVAGLVGSKLTNCFVVTNEAVTSSKMGQALGAPSTWMMAALPLEMVADGADSLLIKGLVETKRNLPLIVGGLGASYGAGELFASRFESVREELGTQPWIAKIFAGLKLIALLHDSTKQQPGERNTLANTVSMLANSAGDSVRALASFAHVLVALKAALKGDEQRREIAGAHFIRPWLDLLETNYLILLNTLDGGLQIATTGARGATSVGIAVMNTITYTLAKLARVCSVRASKGIVESNERLVESIGELGLELKHQATDRFRMFLEKRNVLAAKAEKAAHSKVVEWDPTKDPYPLLRDLYGSRFQPKSKALEHKEIVHDAHMRRKGLVVN